MQTFAALLFAHVLADFLLQNNWLVAHKRKPQVLLLHGLIVLVTLQLAIGSVTAWQVLVLAAIHVGIDAIKTFGFRGTTLWPFLGDQGAHVVTLGITATLFPALWQDGIWANITWLPSVMVIFAGLILATRAGAFAIGLLMAPWANADLPPGLENGGTLIGVLERGLIFVLLLVGQPTGVGFLIAAKSVLRYDTTSGDQRAAEYVIIGTLASFGWALVCGYGTLVLLAELPPLGISFATP